MWHDRCSNCGIYEGVVVLWNYDVYCEDCANRLVEQCDCCGRLYDSYQVKMFRTDRSVVCEFCYEGEEL